MMDVNERTAQPRAKRARGWMHKLVPVVLVTTVAAGVGVVAWIPGRTEPPPESGVPPVNVVTRRVERIAQLADRFELAAVVEPYLIVRVAAEVPGRIERFAVRTSERTWRGRRFPEGATLNEGDPLEAGEAILYLNRDLLSARLERAEAQFASDDREYRRVLGLFEQGASTQDELEDAKSQRKVSKAMRDEAARQLERTTIVAPIRGVLDRKVMEVGEYASPGDTLVEMVDIARAKVVVNVPQRDVSYLSLGQATEILVDGADPASMKSITGEISYISQRADAQTLSTRVVIGIDNREHRLHAGQIVRVRLTRRMLQDVIMIPLGAVIPLENGKAVYVVEKNQAWRRDVTLGVIQGRSVRVHRGLEDGDALIVAGHRYVGPGQDVRVVPAEDAQSSASLEPQRTPSN